MQPPMEIDGESLAIERGSARDSPEQAVLGSERPTSTFEMVTRRLRSLAANEDVHVCARIRRWGAVETLLQVGSLEQKGADPGSSQLVTYTPGFLLGPQGQRDPADLAPPGCGFTHVRVLHRPPTDILIRRLPNPRGEMPGLGCAGMNILGINAYHGDASAALIVDGQLVAAVEEERFTRLKHDTSFPHRSIGLSFPFHRPPCRETDPCRCPGR